MATSKDKFTFKIILSYLVLGALSVLVGVFLYSEFEKLTSVSTERIGDKKFMETGTLINLVYEADGLSRLALLTEDDSDFERYIQKTDSLFLKIKEIKSLTSNEFQIRQLDSVKSLLIDKNQNIEQLRILGLTNKKDTSLDEIMREVRKLEASVGLNSIETMVKNPSELSARERRIWQAYADYLNQDSRRDTSTIRSKKVDSMLTAARYIVAEAKKENSRIRESLRQKENELILNDLNISERLREIIAGFDAEISKNQDLQDDLRTTSIHRTGNILKFAGILGGGIILVFSYFILSDFFKAERFKKHLEASKNYAETLLKSREQLISTVSHDLKTPLNTITGYSELIENSSLSEKQKYYLSQITSSSHFISNLVDDLLDYSKLEAGKLSVENIPFSLENIIVETGNAVKQAYPNKTVTLKTDISESLKNEIYESDPLRIRQIVNNLVGNAFKFTDNGSVSLEVSKREDRDKISIVEIAITDTGIGISKEKQELIFNEFTQAEDDTAHKFGGSGLGLAISQKLTQLLDGSLSVESELGVGSRFVLTLPLKKSDRVLSKQTSSAKATSFKGLTAVILDDDQAMRLMLKELMEKLDIDTEIFKSYKDFLARANREDSNLSFDFVLTDIQMPQTDGFTVLNNLQTNKIKTYRGQPVIAMTGSREHPRELFIKKGFTQMLRKPFSIKELEETIAQIFPDQISLDRKEETEDSLDSSKNDPFDLGLLQSFMDAPEAMEEVLDIFADQTKVDLAAIKTALDQQDIASIKEIAHRMLSMFRQVRAVEVIPILEKMERYRPDQIDTSQMKKDYKNLVHHTQVLQKALKNR